MSVPDDDALASRILAAGDAAASIAPITDADAGFGLRHAYAVALRVTALRVARGEEPIGWKIGFTNRTIWDEYGVHAPIWAPMYSTTLAHFDAGAGPLRCSIGALAEPRIEPEIALRVARPPHPDMHERELLACVDAVGHGFEIVQSIFPGWRFKAADTVAAFALHGCYRLGPLVSLADAADRSRWLKMLGEFEIVLFRDGREMDRGVAENVLGGPLSALRHLVRGLAEYPARRRIEIGDLITTGTVTRAFPVRAGERWTSQVHGLPLAGIDAIFT